LDLLVSFEHPSQPLRDSFSALDYTGAFSPVKKSGAVNEGKPPHAKTASGGVTLFNGV
jgi:hypothetical protein